nr:immunoglobulin heavy chain junction region [Mus musculus]
CARSNYAMDYW